MNGAFKRITNHFLLVMAMVAGCVACAPQERFVAEQTKFAALPGWQADDHMQALEVFTASCAGSGKRLFATTEQSQITIDEAMWKGLCAAAKNTPADPQQARGFFESYFTPYNIKNDGEAEGLFTGYYEPLLYGSLQKRGDFIHPVYGAPSDIKPDTPYLTRQQIDTQGLAGRAPVLVWVDDPVMLFFMHVQGSGRIRLVDGTDMRLGFAGRNHHPYASVGKVLREEQLVAEDKLDFFGIRHWFYKNPDKAQAMMWNNPSYIFFQKIEETAVKGALGVPLTAGRSLAVDPRYIPYGLPLFLQTQLPAGPDASTPFTRLMMAQDTGSAIRGPVRGDIFFGHGQEAEYYAGLMKSPGRYTLLVPRQVSVQSEP